MADLALLDQAYYTIMHRFIRTGQAPHYTELAAEMGLSVEEGRQLIHDLVKAPVAAWLFPGTDYIASVPPFHNMPTQYRITVEGEQKWFGQ